MILTAKDPLAIVKIIFVEKRQTNMIFRTAFPSISAKITGIQKTAIVCSECPQQVRLFFISSYVTLHFPLYIFL